MMALYMYDAVVEILFFALNAVYMVLLPQQPDDDCDDCFVLMDCG